MTHEQSENINELATALAKAQHDIAPAPKTSENPYFKSRYADLAQCWETLREPLSNNGLSIIQTMGHQDGSVIVYTTLAHSSGQWIRGETRMTPEKRGPQAVGICTTYARRYGLAAITGLVQADDDGEGATDHNGKGVSEKPVQEKPADQLAKYIEWLGRSKDAADFMDRWGRDEYADVRKLVPAEQSKELKERFGIK